MRYWSFFPTGDDGWGHMPAWGFANVVAVDASRASRSASASTATCRSPATWSCSRCASSERGFYDGTPHRLELTSAYNQYQRIRSDAAYRAGQDENYQILLRPLFITSFMLADFLEDNDFFGAEQVLVSERVEQDRLRHGVLLSRTCATSRWSASPRRATRRFVDDLGCYERSVTYDGLESLDRRCARRCTSTSRATRAARCACTRISVRRSCTTATQARLSRTTTSARANKSCRDRSRKPYFAPYQIKKRNADWGAAEVTRKFNEAQLAFIRRVSDAEKPWMLVKEQVGFEAAQELIAALVAGRIDPKDGHVVVLP